MKNKKDLRSVRVSARITQELYKKAMRRCKIFGSSFSDLVKDGIEEILK